MENNGWQLLPLRLDAPAGKGGKCRVNLHDCSKGRGEC